MTPSKQTNLLTVTANSLSARISHRGRVRIKTPTGPIITEAVTEPTIQDTLLSVHDVTKNDKAIIFTNNNAWISHKSQFKIASRKFKKSPRRKIWPTVSPKHRKISTELNSKTHPPISTIRPQLHMRRAQRHNSKYEEARNSLLSRTPSSNRALQNTKHATPISISHITSQATNYPSTTTVKLTQKLSCEHPQKRFKKPQKRRRW